MTCQNASAVNVLVRSHYLPAFSRLGTYDRDLLDRLAYRDRRALEWSTRAASVVPIELYPALRRGMLARDAHLPALGAQIEAAEPGYLDRVLQEVADNGPFSFKDLTHQARRERPKTKFADFSLPWAPMRLSLGKYVLEMLWSMGRLAVAGRTAGFERSYDLTEPVIPEAVPTAPVPDADAAQRDLLLHAARALGIGWVKDFAGYSGITMTAAKARLSELAESGALEPVTVDGFPEQAYLDPDGCSGAAGGPVQAAALQSPFDWLLWERRRNERLPGSRHSFEV